MRGPTTNSRAALELEPTNSFAHHTVAHVMEMTGRPEDGLGWMVAREPFWTREDHFLQNHIWWHRALFHLELGQYDEALALYDGPLVASQKPMARSLTNSSALLWRLGMLGYDVADRWKSLAMHWEGHADGRCFVFHDMHAAMAELGSGQEDAGRAQDLPRCDRPRRATMRLRRLGARSAFRWSRA